LGRQDELIVARDEAHGVGRVARGGDDHLITGVDVELELELDSVAGAAVVRVELDAGRGFAVEDQGGATVRRAVFDDSTLACLGNDEVALEGRLVAGVQFARRFSLDMPRTKAANSGACRSRTPTWSAPTA